MKPIRFLSETETLTGDGVFPLPVCEISGMLISRWQVEDWREWLALLFHRKIWVSVLGARCPPISITGFQAAKFVHPEAEKTIAQEEKPCARKL